MYFKSSSVSCKSNSSNQHIHSRFDSFWNFFCPTTLCMEKHRTTSAASHWWLFFFFFFNHLNFTSIDRVKWTGWACKYLKSQLPPGHIHNKEVCTFSTYSSHDVFIWLSYSFVMVRQLKVCLDTLGMYCLCESWLLLQNFLQDLCVFQHRVCM